MRANWGGVMSEISFERYNHFRDEHRDRWVCDSCSALVIDKGKHNNWHSGLLEGYEPSQAKVIKRWMSVKSPEQLAKEKSQ